jgi:hypothetical protein
MSDRTFATLVGVAGTYCHAEADEDAYAALRRRARRPDDEEMARFESELRDALTWLPAAAGLALYSRVRYEDGSTPAFLRRLWRDLYPDMPVPED